MALTEDTKLKLTAGVYGDFVTNGDVNNANPNFGYKPNLGNTTHEALIADLLSDDNIKIKNALTIMDIVDQGEQMKVIGALPKNTDLDVAVAVYKKIKADINLHRPPDAQSHDY